MKLYSRLFFVICFLVTLFIISDIEVYAQDTSYTTSQLEETACEDTELPSSDVAESNEGETINTIMDSEVDFETSVIVNTDRDTYTMPTADAIVSEKNQKYVDRIANTDKWNDMILEISREYNCDPCFVKVIMVIESSGEVDAVAKNGCYFGLFQVGKDFKYDNKKMLEDPEYATRCGIEVMKIKADAATTNGNIPTVYEVAKRYNGSDGYAKRVSQIYEELSGGSRDNIVFNE